MKYRTLTAALVCMIAAGCASPKLLPDAPFAATSLGDSETVDAAETDFLTRYPELARRAGETLRLTFRTGTTVRLKNRDSECYEFKGDPYNCYRFYSVLGYWAAKDLYFVVIGLYEGHRTIFISSNGTAVKLLGIPKLSPDGQYFVDYADACDAYGNHSAFALWKANGGVEKVYQRDFPARPDDDEFGVTYSFDWLTHTSMQTYAQDCARYKEPAKPSGIVIKDTDGQWRWDFERDMRK